MMNKNVFVLAGALLLCASCGSGQKPAPRADVWENNSIQNRETVKSIELKGNTVRVPFKRTASDLAEVQISLNGVPFNMWWDTGASITCISSLELVKLQKEGKITDDDFVGTIQSSIADGSTVESAVFSIKEVVLKGQDDGHYLRLNDVLVAVSENIEAPLLLGQNVIQNLPKHSFDDSQEVIEFEKQ